jgi:hypothetical protein
MYETGVKVPDKEMGASTAPVRKSDGTLGLLVGVGILGGAFGSLLTGGVAAFNLGGVFVFDSMLCVVAVLCLLTALKRERRA